MVHVCMDVCKSIVRETTEININKFGSPDENEKSSWNVEPLLCIVNSVLLLLHFFQSVLI